MCYLSGPQAVASLASAGVVRQHSRRVEREEAPVPGLEPRAIVLVQAALAQPHHLGALLCAAGQDGRCIHLGQMVWIACASPKLREQTWESSLQVFASAAGSCQQRFKCCHAASQMTPRDMGLTKGLHISSCSWCLVVRFWRACRWPRYLSTSASKSAMRRAAACCWTCTVSAAPAAAPSKDLIACIAAGSADCCAINYCHHGKPSIAAEPSKTWLYRICKEWTHLCTAAGV